MLTPQTGSCADCPEAWLDGFAAVMWGRCLERSGSFGHRSVAVEPSIIEPLST